MQKKMHSLGTCLQEQGKKKPFGDELGGICVRRHTVSISYVLVESQAPSWR